MIIILKRNANPEKVEILKQELEHKGFKLHLSQGTQTSLIGLIGDTTAIHEDLSLIHILASTLAVMDDFGQVA